MDDAVDGIATYRRHDNVVLTRTFSKAYGLAGFRVGYAVAPAADRRRAAGGLAALRRLDGRPGRGDRVARAPGRAARAGRRPGRRARPRRRRPARGRLGRARGAGQLRVVRARRADRRVRGRRRRGRHRRCARSPARARGSPSARPRPTTGWSRWPRPSGPEWPRAGSSAGAGRRSISRQRGSTAGSIVTRKYAAPTISIAGSRPTPATSRPPRRPPSGISAKHIAVLSDVTRPISGAGIRSKMTAPRIGLRKPDAKPPTTQTASTDPRRHVEREHHEAGQPETRNATR